MANSGRKKHVSSGTASVHKRGSGTGSGHVGRPGGYSGKTGSSSSFGGHASGGSHSSYSGSNHSSSGYTGGSGYNGGSSGNNGGAQRGTAYRGGGLLGSLLSGILSSKRGRTIALILVVCLVLYLMMGGSCGGCGACLTLGSGGGFDLGGLGGLSSEEDFAAYGVAGETSTEQSVDLSVSNNARAKRTVLKGEGRDVVTIMVYMCGADLESKYGMATSDLKEMIASKVGGNVQLIVQTGGAKKWQNSTVSTTANQIYRVTGQGLDLLAESKKAKMTDPGTLSAFIKYCKKNFPADRYGLIMWDHGGGSLSGYGYDENYANDSMTLDELNVALRDGGCAFDFVGFDACLMATLENALVMEQYADYLIASEETEPGIGWYYTDWLAKLTADPSMPTVEIGKNIIDDFVKMCGKASPNDKTTLSITDLAELAGTVPEAFSRFADSTNEMVQADNYKTVSNARSRAREFASGINQVDLIDLCQGIGSTEANDFVKVLKGCIKYNRTSKNIAGANGLSIYFPAGRSSNVSSAISTYNKIGLDDSYTQCIKSFANVSASGQIASGTAGSLTDSLFGGSSSSTQSGGSLLDMIGMLGGSAPSSSSGNSDLIGAALGAFLGNSNASSMTGILSGDTSGWFDNRAIQNSADYVSSNYLDPDHVKVTTNEDGVEVIDLTKEEWDLVQDIQLNVFVEDEDGYIDLGMDNVYETDKNGDLIFDYDNTWITINGHAVSYYMMTCDERKDNYVITGRVPARLNGQPVDIILEFTSANEEGVVAGARPLYENGETDTVARGLIEIKKGDVIDFLCDHYKFDQTFEDSYLLGDQFIVDGDLEISNMAIGDAPKLVTYCLTDIYGNEIWTDATEYYPNEQ